MFPKFAGFCNVVFRFSFGDAFIQARFCNLLIVIKIILENIDNFPSHLRLNEEKILLGF